MLIIFIIVVKRIIFDILFCNIHFIIKSNFLLFMTFLFFYFYMLRIFPISPFMWIFKDILAFLKHLVQVLHSERFLQINKVLILNLVWCLWQRHFFWFCLLLSFLHNFLYLFILINLLLFLRSIINSFNNSFWLVVHFFLLLHSYISHVFSGSLRNCICLCLIFTIVVDSSRCIFQ